MNKYSKKLRVSLNLHWSEIEQDEYRQNRIEGNTTFFGTYGGRHIQIIPLDVQKIWRRCNVHRIYFFGSIGSRHKKDETKNGVVRF